MKRPLYIWLTFVTCLVIVLTALAWLSHEVIRLDRAEQQATRQASFEEDIRLALWRMDALISPVIAQESGRPYFAYNAFYPLQRAYTRMYSPLGSGEILTASPLLSARAPYVQLHFQIQPTGEFVSPQAPSGNMQVLAEEHFVTAEAVDKARDRLEELRNAIGGAGLIAQLPEPKDHPRFLTIIADEEQPRVQQGETNPQEQTSIPQAGVNGIIALSQPPAAQQQAFQSIGDPKLADSKKFKQRVLNTREMNARIGNLDQYANFVRNNDSLPSAAVPPVDQGLAKCIWINDHLLLARRVRLNGDEYVQGCWLDWGTIRTSLLRKVKHLLPEAQLAPVTDPQTTGSTRLLASIPVSLNPGPLPRIAHVGLTPARKMLMIAWASALLAGIAVVVLLVGIMTLSERRAAFVSAVTHEMRTPLTTFRMYTDMLTSGMVQDAQKRHRYLATLKQESDRLTHLVENVLAYARLDGNGSKHRAAPIEIARLLERSWEQLEQRAARSNMKLVTTENGQPHEEVLAEPAAVEQILVNLVDNACKYARNEHQPEVEVMICANGQHCQLRVRDHGPGIARHDASRLFRPFCKSASEAASSAPGVGLGLALSRRLARQMGGDLRLDQSVNDGACFVLELATVSHDAGKAD